MLKKSPLPPDPKQIACLDCDGNNPNCVHCAGTGKVCQDCYLPKCKTLGCECEQ